MSEPTKKVTFLKGSVALHLILIAVLGLLAYSNTFDVPFQWDEEYLIGQNPIVKDLDYFLEPSKAKGSEYYGALKGRYIGYLTFALNYKLHGFDVRGYHAFNITIHILNALLVYFLVLLTFKTPFFNPPSSPLKLRGDRGGLFSGNSKYIALFSGLLFVSHPIQTEAITYIFQRLASLMAFFYLLSVVSYISSRLSEGKTRRYGLYAVSLISAVLAMKTKENAFTLPIVIMLYEFFFFRDAIRIRMFRLIPLLLTLLIIPLRFIGFDRPVGEIVGSIGYSGISRSDYLFTQFRVIVTYIRLLFLPLNQNIDYDYPIFHSLFNPQVFLSFLFLLSIFCLGIYLLYRSRSRVELRLLAFGLFWFFITLSIESSVIPIPMVIDEYRVYLPSVGVFVALTTAVFLVIQRRHSIKVPALIGLTLITVVLSGATYARNNVWGSGISLWEDAVSKSPQKATAHNNLAIAYKSKGFIDKAIEHYLTALRLKPNYAKAHTNLGFIYLAQGQVDEAIKHFEIAVSLRGDARIHLNLGIAYKAKGMTEKAKTHLDKARELTPALFKLKHIGR